MSLLQRTRTRREEFHSYGGAPSITPGTHTRNRPAAHSIGDSEPHRPNAQSYYAKTHGYSSSQDQQARLLQGGPNHTLPWWFSNYANETFYLSRQVRNEGHMLQVGRDSKASKQWFCSQLRRPKSALPLATAHWRAQAIISRDQRMAGINYAASQVESKFSPDLIYTSQTFWSHRFDSLEEISPYYNLAFSAYTTLISIDFAHCLFEVYSYSPLDGNSVVSTFRNYLLSPYFWLLQIPTSFLPLTLTLLFDDIKTFTWWAFGLNRHPWPPASAQRLPKAAVPSRAERV